MTNATTSSPACAHCGADLKGEAFCEAEYFHDNAPVCEPCMNNELDRLDEEKDPETRMEDRLAEALDLYADDMEIVINHHTFADAGILTRNKGLVVKIDGKKFQLTIVQA